MARNSGGGVGQSQLVGMSGLFELCKDLSPEIAICIRGRHAVGKSESVDQVAAEVYDDFYKDTKNCELMTQALKHEPHIAAILRKNNAETWRYEFGIPVIMRRLSQLTEGDITGLPILGGRGTQFRPCDWLLNACDFPCILFLDERNRALDGVKQAVFQLTDSKAFYGHRLHNGTRVYIAENIGDNYSVQACDPAEVSRCATVELDPSVEEWLAYAKKKNIHEHVIDFISQNHKALEFTGDFQPNHKYPDRRSWFKLGFELDRQQLFEKPESRLFLVLAGAMIGTEQGIAFTNFCKNIERNVTPAEVLTDWKKAKKKLGKNIVAERYLALQKKVGEYLVKHKVTAAESIQIKEFFRDLPPEHRIAFFNDLQANHENMLLIHSEVWEDLLQTCTTVTPDAPEAPKTRAKK